MPFAFHGKKILVTGAGRGIGRELAKAIAICGGEVYALGKTAEYLESLAEEQSNIYPITVDLNDWDATGAALLSLEPVDGVVNNAVVLEPYCEAINIDKGRLGQTMNVNLMAPINVIQVTAKKMIEHGIKGSIVNVSSIAGVNPIRHMMDYCVSKAGLGMITKQFALELGAHNIRVNSVNPMWVLTEAIQGMIEACPEFEKRAKSITPMGRFCEFRDVVEPIMYMLSEHSSMVTGTIHLVDGGLLSNIPV